MSEYIIRTTNMPEHVREALSTWYEINEEIVRCRDCVSYQPDMCCEMFVFADDRISHVDDPDGFCAWGERRGSE